MPQPLNSSGPSSDAATRAARSGEQMPLHRACPGVGGHGVDRQALAVEREGVGARVLQPEPVLESLPERGSRPPPAAPPGSMSPRRRASRAMASRPWYTYPCTSTSEMGPSASRPSAQRMASAESFQPWLRGRHRTVGWYATKPLASADRSIQPRAAMARARAGRPAPCRPSSARTHPAGPATGGSSPPSRSRACGGSRRRPPSRRSAARGGSCPAARHASRPSRWPGGAPGPSACPARSAAGWAASGAR